MEPNIDQALRQATTAHNAGNLQEAERLYRAVLEIQPLHAHANHNLGLIAVSMNQPGVALPFLKIAIDVNPNIEQFWLSYVETLIAERHFENAKQATKKAKKKGVAKEKIKGLTQKLVLAKAVKNSIQAPSQADTQELLNFYQNGQYGDAEKLATSIIKKSPDHLWSWKVLGAVLGESGRLNEALLANQNASRLDAGDAILHCNVGAVMMDLGRLAEAEASFKKAIAIDSGAVEAHTNLAAILLSLRRLEEAEASYRQAIALQPNDAETYCNLGITLSELGRLEESEASFRKAIALKPDYSEVKHLLASLTGDTTNSAPRDFVEKLFDGYASKFDHSLVENLDYKMPKMISDVIMEHCSGSALGAVLDLGCGTGLAGVEVREHCTYLEGIDLSNSMLEKARSKNIYDKLTHCGIRDFLSITDLNFDYFISTDVFIYIGDLTDVFRLIKSRNRSGGKFVFSTENTHKKGFFLERSGRYSHSKTYIESLCKKFGYGLSHFETRNLRKEKGEFISGGLYLLDF